MQIESTRELHNFPATFRAWISFASPRLLFTLVLVTALLRWQVADFSMLDLMMVLAGAALWPFLEWSLHRYLLHMKPLRLVGRVLDLDFMRKHRAHHAEPFRPELIVFPAYVPLVFAPLLLLGAYFLAPDRALGLSFLLGFSCAALNYEWTHFLVHTAISPRSGYYQGLFRNHRLHHFRNENYWFGFTFTSVDTLLGTGPQAEDAPRSPNCRDLGVPAGETLS